MLWKVKLRKTVDVIVPTKGIFSKIVNASRFVEEIMDFPPTADFVHADQLKGLYVKRDYIGRGIYNEWEIIQAERVE